MSLETLTPNKSTPHSPVSSAGFTECIPNNLDEIRPSNLENWLPHKWKPPPEYLQPNTNRSTQAPYDKDQGPSYTSRFVKTSQTGRLH